MPRGLELMRHLSVRGKPILGIVRMHASLDTPYIYVHEPTLRNNIRRLAQYAAKHDIHLRPHSKTHKSLQIGRWQLQAGAIGLTVAKLGEAELFASACRDLLLAYPIVDDQRAVRLAELAGRIEVTLAVDSIEALECLSHAASRVGTYVGVLVDLDVGLHRTGVQNPEETLRLAQQVDRLPNLRLRGLFFYPGHVWELPEKQGPRLQ